MKARNSSLICFLRRDICDGDIVIPTTSPTKSREQCCLYNRAWQYTLSTCSILHNNRNVWNQLIACKLTANNHWKQSCLHLSKERKWIKKGQKDMKKIFAGEIYHYQKLRQPKFLHQNSERRSHTSVCARNGNGSYFRNYSLLTNKINIYTI